MDPQFRNGRFTVSPYGYESKPGTRMHQGYPNSWWVDVYSSKYDKEIRKTGFDPSPNGDLTGKKHKNAKNHETLDYNGQMILGSLESFWVTWLYQLAKERLIVGL